MMETIREHRRMEAGGTTAGQRMGSSPAGWQAWCGGEVLLLALVAPVLWFPSLRPSLILLALGVLAGLWVVQAAVGEGLWPRSRYDYPLLALLLAATWGACHSQSPALTVPKVTGLVLGLALFRFVLQWGRDRQRLVGLLGVLLGLALLFALVGLMNGVRATKVPGLQALLARLPRLIQDLPGAEHGLASANQLGGTLLYVLPVGLAVLLAPGRLPASIRLSVGAAALVLLVALVLTQSRSAWAGMVVGVLALLALLWPWGRWFALGVLLLVVVAWLGWGKTALEALIVQMWTPRTAVETAVGSVNLHGRLLIWARAWDCVLHSPLGCGWGTFRLLDGDPTAARSIFDVGTPHAHNVFLQVAYDFGVPGLIAYLAILGQAARTAWQTYRRTDGLPRAWAAGALAALVAYHVYGLTDVVALGSKPGILWWGLVAWIAALGRISEQRPAG
jgi:putative inorganic carbon (HCO3(-)) transporter